MSNQEGEAIRKIQRRKHVRLSEPRIPPLDKKEIRKLRRKFQDKSEWDKLVQICLEAEKGFPPRFNLHATIGRYENLYFGYMMFEIHMRFLSSLPDRDRELIILRISWLCHSKYLWVNHILGGKRAGLSDDDINLIVKGPEAEGWDSFDANLLRAVNDLYTNSFITDETWDVLAERYDTNQIMDLVFTVGNYNMLAMVLNTFGVQLDEFLKTIVDNPRIPKMK